MAHTAFGGLVALAWLLLPTATRTAAEGPPRAPHAAERAVVRVMGPPVGAGPATAAPALLAVPAAAGTERTAAPADDSSGSDLILPVAAAGTAVAVAAYSLVRRRRRVRLRTTPTGGYEAPTTPLTDLHHRARRLLVETDDSVRTSTEELGYAAARPGDTDEPPTDQPPSDQPSASKPDTEKSGLDRPDAEQPDADGPHLDRPDVEKPDADESDAAEPPAAGPLGSRAARPFVLDPAQPFAETPAARDAVRPFVEALADARGELVAAFGAGLRLEEESETLSPDEERALLEEILTWCTTAQRRLDTATPAFDQLRALERDITPALECAEARFRELTGRTATAAGTLTALHDTYAPAASLPVTGHVEQAKDRLVFATTELNRARQSAYPGDLDTAAVHLRAAEGAIHQADLFVTGVERLAAELARAAELAKQGTPSTGPYDDPLDALRRQGRPLLPSRSAVAAAADFITTHRAAVGVGARIRLAEAERHLELAGEDKSADHAHRADTLAAEARGLAEQDVRAYGNPYGGPVGDGLAGALLGGIILGEPAEDTGRTDPRGPACYGGTATRARRATSGRY
ncbi:hypothetical protein PV330_12530 [Streptomyces caniscabiei]|uniref:hypothetical protein n=1 Tax=Streptomyces caniscabiei TaxID=2746961 RepID=UPI0029ADDC17|nr:hypothetical protein [Streptomyces caniscabiei]MDX2600851.1 hypothetical protein [Streptomyces caniscabiei]MDX2740701.1 hypothetical protein [Streptomyces caniscabiei]